MAKTRKTAEKPALADAEERTDGLEIISIGSLYKGPWDKKYWTTSRGKDRYPYPVGYEAVRAHNGATYKMEIHEGVNGPRFLISSDDGCLSSGKTPDQVWEEFKKKCCPRMKIWHGKRLSSKMDGLELFGFRNPFIQRLLRELVADINGIAEQRLVSPNICDTVSRPDHDDYFPNVSAYPDLLLCLGKPCVTRKRSRCELKNKNIKIQARPQSLELTCSSGTSNVKNEKSLGQGSYTIQHGSGEVNGADNGIGESAPLQIMSCIGESSNCISSKNRLLLNPIDVCNNKSEGDVPSKRLTGFLYSSHCKTMGVTENLSTVEPLRGSHDVELKISTLLVSSEDKELMQSCSKESVGCIDIDLCVPDTIDFEQENASESASHKLEKNAYNETVYDYEINSRDLLNAAEHEEMLESKSHPSFEKSNFGSGGQDVAKSMMSLLLPQAVPLLNNVSTDKEFTICPSDMFPSQMNFKEERNEVGCILDIPSSDVVMTEAAYGKQGEMIHGPHTDQHSNTPNSEHMKFIIPDSFEYSPCDDFKTNQEILSSDIAEAGRSSLNKEMCSEQVPDQDLANGTSTYHASVLDFKDRPQDCDVCIPESVIDDMSPKDWNISERSDNACSDLKKHPVHFGYNSLQKDESSALEFTGGVSNAFSGVKTKICHMETEKSQGEVVGKIVNAEKLMSSQLPNLVYTRRKFQNAIPFQKNCAVIECTDWDKFKLVSTEMYTAKGTLPVPEIIQMNNSNDKLCEPDDSVGLREETPQTRNDVQGEHSNLVEPNLTSSQNPTPLACENICVGAKEAQLISEPLSLRSQELKNNLGSSVKFVGCYVHPMPVSSLFLRTREDEIHVCVLCGLLMGQQRTLFTYKVAINEPSLGCPSVMAHCSILLPDPKHNFIKETMVERSGVQLTPDGQHIVLMGSIKTPNCSEGKIDCSCSTCTSVCSLKNALKIVEVEHGYVSVITTLETVDSVHCILVCEPNRLVSVGDSGRLQVWVMNSTWSEKLEYFIIPADGSMSPGIVELKKVPKCTHLVVGYNSCGEFSLWDIVNLDCVSRFSALESPINEFFPISLFHWQTKSSEYSYASMEEHAYPLLEATNSWYSEQSEICSFPSSGKGDVAMWLFVSTTSDIDCCDDHVSTSSDVAFRSWKLALSMKNSITFGSPLDPRITAIGVSRGYGIVGTSDGAVYMWELSRGSKVGTLHHFQDGNVTCVTTDDSRGALGVAGGGQLFLYLHLPELDSN
ncbi:uncharacterized protein LOC113858262 [Abrus precatorius]|uniref:Uncharacterized protein LOC113858262 n=1 Tax=Abrus precatorius TaxID=3816 RepID=A0A8B8KRT7_ABRPR|nr:uncharacterized protein LOC113858262 [Abrus precatorius]